MNSILDTLIVLPRRNEVTTVIGNTSKISFGCLLGGGFSMESISMAVLVLAAGLVVAAAAYLQAE
jgi:hypothetical protein